MFEQRAVEFRIQREWAQLRAAHEPLAVEQNMPASCERRERLRRKVGAEQRRDVDPARTSVQLSHVVGAPCVADRVD